MKKVIFSLVISVFLNSDKVKSQNDSGSNEKEVFQRRTILSTSFQFQNFDALNSVLEKYNYPILKNNSFQFSINRRIKPTNSPWFGEWGLEFTYYKSDSNPTKYKNNQTLMQDVGVNFGFGLLIPLDKRKQIDLGIYIKGHLVYRDLTLVLAKGDSASLNSILSGSVTRQSFNSINIIPDVGTAVIFNKNILKSASVGFRFDYLTGFGNNQIFKIPESEAGGLYISINFL